MEKTRVFKKSGKPFKSGLKVNTVKGVIDHPVLTGKKAFTFEEDESFVSVEQCRTFLPADFSTQAVWDD